MLLRKLTPVASYLHDGDDDGDDDFDDDGYPFMLILLAKLMTMMMIMMLVMMIMIMMMMTTATLVASDLDVWNIRKLAYPPLPRCSNLPKKTKCLTIYCRPFV